MLENSILKSTGKNLAEFKKVQNLIRISHNSYKQWLQLVRNKSNNAARYWFVKHRNCIAGGLR